MKSSLHIIVVFFLASLVTGCTSHGNHSVYRGSPNVPHHRIVPLGIDPNVIFSMTDVDYNRYMNRLERYQGYTANAIQLDVRAANAAKQWVNDSNKANTSLNGFERIVPNASKSFSYELNRAVRESIQNVFN